VIKSLRNIQLAKHPRNTRLDTAIQTFVDYEDRVQNMPTSKKHSLAINKDFSNDLINTTHEANKPKVREINRPKSLGN